MPDVNTALADLAAKVQANSDAEDSAIALLNSLGDIIRQTPATVTAINALADAVQAKADALGAAVVANTPVA